MSVEKIKFSYKCNTCKGKFLFYMDANQLQNSRNIKKKMEITECNSCFSKDITFFELKYLTENYGPALFSFDDRLNYREYDRSHIYNNQFESRHLKLNKPPPPPPSPPLRIINEDIGKRIRKRKDTLKLHRMSIIFILSILFWIFVVTSGIYFIISSSNEETKPIKEETWDNQTWDEDETKW